MPNYLKGDIFRSADSGDFELAVVIGHRGLNVLGSSFDGWLHRNPAVAASFERASPDRQSARIDPFSELEGPHQFAEGRYMWFFKDDDGGMTNDALSAILEDAMSWANKKGFKTVIANGIKDQAGVNDDDVRVQFMRDLAKSLELKWNLQMTLISSDDSFTRGE